jgi:hypothetical protein
VGEALGLAAGPVQLSSNPKTIPYFYLFAERRNVACDYDDYSKKGAQWGSRSREKLTVLAGNVTGGGNQPSPCEPLRDSVKREIRQ